MTAGTDPFGTVMISLAINCDGALYAHNIADDALYQIDRTTAAPSLNTVPWASASKLRVWPSGDSIAPSW